VRGSRDGDLQIFRGIRYGADTGARRFMPPVAPAAWRGIADATAFGAASVQPGSEPNQSEDCLFLNVTAPIHLATRLLPMLRARPEAMIVNVTSGLAIAPRAASPIYCATKAALRSFSMALRAQLKGSGVHVLEVLPPVVETKMTASRSGGKMPAAECARQAVAAMEAGRDEANVGQVKLLRFVYSLSPALARRVMMGF